MKTTFFYAIALLGFWGMSQSANDCSNAIVVCGNSVITSDVSGFGNQELDPALNPCSNPETNSLWLQLNIDQTGLLEFTLTPDDPDILVDYDFLIFGPNYSCGSFDAPIRCSTTNPNQAELDNNLTGLRNGETDQSEGPGPAGNSFVAPLSVTAGETYYLLIDRPEGSGGFSLDWQGSSDFVDPPPILVDEPDPLTVCFADNGLPLDLTANEDQIATDPSVSFSYYESRSNAFDGVRAISDPAAYPVTEPTTIYVKATNGNSCFEILEQRIEIDPPFSADISAAACDANGDGTGDFDLVRIRDQIADGLQNSASYLISLHPTENDADTDQAALTGASYTSVEGAIYGRIASNTDAACFLIITIPLEVLPPPPPLPAGLVQCDLDLTDSADGLASFNLEQLLADRDRNAFQYTFYESEADRTAGSGPVSLENYTNSVPFDQTLFYKIEGGNCERLGEVALQVVTTVVETSPGSPLNACGEIIEDGLPVATFDLDAFTSTNYPDADTAIYASLEDASLERNVLAGTLTSESTTLFVRIEEANQCRRVEELELIVHPLPEVQLEETYTVCSENPNLNITAPADFDTYTWSKLEQDAETEIATTVDVTLLEPGNYRLVVGKVFGSDGTICENSFDFSVIPVAPPEIANINITGTASETTLEILVSGEGEYEYALDDGEYSDGNRFMNLPAGSVTVRVRDKNGCGEVAETISILGVPEFFTPNGDAVNDFWQIIGADPASSTTATISIYDRYGKFIGQIDPFGPGWDGSYNNEPLPESDYWYRINISGQREMKGHFTLKR